MRMAIATVPGPDCGGRLFYIALHLPIRVGDVLVWAKRCTTCGREVQASALISTCPLMREVAS